MNSAGASRSSDPALPTPAMQDYLKAIDRLQTDSVPVSTQRIAEQLRVAPPSVTNMLKRLHDSGLIDYEPYHGVKLTGVGRRIARTAIRRRELLERYLIERLEYRPEEARIEAIHLERGVTDALVAHITEALGESDERDGERLRPWDVNR